MQPELTLEQKCDWLQLIKSENVGPATFFHLLNRFGGARPAIKALPELSRRGGLNRRIRIYDRDKAERDIENITRLGAQLVAFGEADYPAALRSTDAAPPLLCVKGRPELLNRPTIALVGSRNASMAGIKMAGQLARELGRAGFVTVSGLARGIDTAIHTASRDTGTIAVIAGGIDNFYPPENTDLQKTLFCEGVVVTEMTPGLRPQARHFPRRNRIIAGIARATIVVEAAVRSGSLITARIAAEQNRDVLAVPGSPLDPRAGGTNKLIANGAALVTNAQDVMQIVGSPEDTVPFSPGLFQNSGLDEQSQDMPPARNSLPDHNLRQEIINLLGPAPTQIDDLARHTGSKVEEIRALMLELELAGRLERHTGQRVSLKS